MNSSGSSQVGLEFILEQLYRNRLRFGSEAGKKSLRRSCTILNSDIFIDGTFEMFFIVSGYLSTKLARATTTGKLSYFQR